MFVVAAAGQAGRFQAFDKGCSEPENGNAAQLLSLFPKCSGNCPNRPVMQKYLHSGFYKEIGATSNGSFSLTRKSVPHHDGKCLIHNVSRNRVLTCHDGHLRLEPADIKEENGFRGFKNVAEGAFLGHGLGWDFCAKVYHHKSWEDFTLRHMEGDMYLIQTLYLWKQRKEDGNGLFREDDGGTLWEFIKVTG
ncbi:unnamed protein product [Fusarium langsethiae]|nr:unnamed protein product [Fusarium langsethiae]